MAVQVSEPEKHVRYEIEEVVILATDPHTKQQVSVRFYGTGVALVEPVLRKTDKNPKIPVFDGNQISLVLSIQSKDVTEL